MGEMLKGRIRGDTAISHAVAPAATFPAMRHAISLSMVTTDSAITKSMILRVTTSTFANAI